MFAPVSPHAFSVFSLSGVEKIIGLVCRYRGIAGNLKDCDYGTITEDIEVQAGPVPFLRLTWPALPSLSGELCPVKNMFDTNPVPSAQYGSSSRF